MKQNPDLLREIMLAVQKQPAGKPLYGSGLKVGCDNPHELGDHVQQLVEMHYLDGVVHPGKIHINRITATGHDFIHAVHDAAVWSTVKEKVMQPTVSWTLPLAVEYAERLTRERLGLPAVPPHS